MSNSDLDAVERELSKRDRLVNAWLAAGEDASNDTIAQLAGASASYASRVGREMAGGDVSEGEVEAARVPELVEEYERQLEAGAVGETGGGADPSGDTTEGPPGGTQSGGEPAGRAGASGGSQRPPGGDQPSRQGSPRGTAAGGRGGQSPEGAGGGQQAVELGVSVPDEERYVPVSVLAEIDNALSLYEEEAGYEVRNSSPQGSQNQVALAKLFVVQKARALLSDAAENAVTADET